MSKQTKQLRTVKRGAALVSAASMTEGRGLRNKALRLTHDITMQWFELGGVLSKIRHGNYYLMWEEDPYGTFDDYVRVELGLSPKASKDCMKLYEVVSGLDREQVEWIFFVGWSKARLVSSVLAEDNLDLWGKVCQRGTVEEVRKEIALYQDGDRVRAREEMRGEVLERVQIDDDDDDETVEVRTVTRDPNVKRRRKKQDGSIIHIDPSGEEEGEDGRDWINLSVYPEQKEGIFEAIELAREISGRPDLKMSAAIHYICEHFIAGNSTRRTRDGHLELVGEMLRLEVVGYDHDQDVFVKGRDMAKAVVNS